MRRDLLDNMADVELSHWWFKGRRRLLAQVVEGLGLPDSASILDAGCGTGGNLATWARFCRVLSFEMDDGARAAAQARGVTEVAVGHLPDGVPFAAHTFDLVLCTDVLEHVPDDRAALHALRAVLKPSGVLVITVPALPWLWSEHDAIHGHQRRYRRAELVGRLQEAGLRVERCTGWNGLLLGPAVASRVAARVLRRPAGPLTVPSAPVNRGLSGVLAAERAVLARADLPIGVSWLVVARRQP